MNLIWPTHMFKSSYFSISICIKGFIFIFLCNCSNHATNLSSELQDECFYTFENRSAFDDHITFHKEAVKSFNNTDSMRSLGCAYYQKGDLLTAEKWLTNAYDTGDSGSAIALTAIYIKEGDFEKVSSWQSEVAFETDSVRWLNIVKGIKRYKKFNTKNYLQQAYNALQYKISYEGKTNLTVHLLKVMDDLLKQEDVCQELIPPEQTSSECSIVDFNERKNYIYVLAEGVLSTMIPAVPMAWKYDPSERSDLKNSNKSNQGNTSESKTI